MQPNENIVAYLKRRIGEARKLGFHVRVEPMEEGQSGWCQIGAKKILFLDASRTAAEQLGQLDEALADFRRLTATGTNQIAA